MARETKEVEDFFHGYAQDFDLIYGHEEKRNALGRWIDKNTRQTMFLRFEETLRHTSKSNIQSIVDVGCGGGRYVLEFLKQGKHVIGLDLAEGMLKLAKRKLEESGIKDGTVEWVKSDYMDFKPREQYDAACFMGFFDYISEPLGILKKLKRDVRVEAYGSFPKRNHILTPQRVIRYKMRSCPLYLYSKSDIEKLMQEAGIKKFTIKDFGRDFYVHMQLHANA